MARFGRAFPAHVIRIKPANFQGPANTVTVPAAGVAVAQAPLPSLSVSALPPAATATATALTPVVAVIVRPGASTATASSSSPTLKATYTATVATATASAPTPQVSQNATVISVSNAGGATASAPASSLSIKFVPNAASATAAQMSVTPKVWITSNVASATAVLNIPTLVKSLTIRALPSRARATMISPGITIPDSSPGVTLRLGVKVKQRMDNERFRPTISYTENFVVETTLNRYDFDLSNALVPIADFVDRERQIGSEVGLHYSVTIENATAPAPPKGAWVQAKQHFDGELSTEEFTPELAEYVITNTVPYLRKLAKY